MALTTSFFTLALLVLPSFAVPTQHIHIKRAGNPFDGQHIVLLHDGVSVGDVLSSLSLVSKITTAWDIINGFAGNFEPGDLAALGTNPGVQAIYENETVGRTDEPLTQYVAFA